jgi:dihydrofolate reductase
MIAAVDEAGVIGYEGGVPWRLPADLRWFREKTMGKPVIMGRRTYESIGRPLPGRHNIVVTHQQDYQAVGCEVVSSPAKALIAAAALHPPEIAVIGGAALYAALFPFASRLYLTTVAGRFPGDTYFPRYDVSDWQVVEETAHPADERHSVPFCMAVLERRSVPAPWSVVANDIEAANAAKGRKE